MKKIIIGLSAIALVAVLGLFTYQQSIKANSSRFEHTYTATATSTLVSATTTLTAITSGADRADLAVIFRASSSSASLKWTYEYSNNAVDWYGEDYISNQSNLQFNHSSTTPIHMWTPSTWIAIGTTSSSSMRSVLNIPVSNSNYMRVNFYPVGANGLIWADLSTKIQY